MSILKENKTTYEFSLDNIKDLIVKDLNINHSTHKVDVDFIQTDVSNERYDTVSRYEVTGLKVTISKRDYDDSK